jgi:hypothetical protein
MLMLSRTHPVGVQVSADVMAGTLATSKVATSAKDAGKLMSLRSENWCMEWALL